MKLRIDSWSHWLRALLFALMAFLITSVFEHTDVFKQVDRDLTDTQSRLLARDMRFDNVVVIDIDEDSAAELQPVLGAWPYDREIFALTTQWLKQIGVRAIAFDIVFAEPRAGDQAFAATLDERVVLAAGDLNSNANRKTDAAYQTALEKISWGVAPQPPVYALWDLTLPIAQLTVKAKIGVVSARPDPDGTLRRTPLVYSAYGRLMPSIALALWYAGEAVPRVETREGQVSVGGKSWAVSPEAEVVLRYPKNLDGLLTVPFAQLVRAANGAKGHEQLAAKLRGKRVIIGNSMERLGDFMQTPMANNRQSGVKLNAMVAELLFSGQVLKPRSLGWDLFLIASVLALVIMMGHPRWQSKLAVQLAVFPLVIVFAGIFVGVADAWGQAMGLLFAISAGFVTHISGMIYRQLQLFRQNQRLEIEKRAATQADALKSQFLSHITHELRTPLTAIMGFNNINWHGSDLGRDQRMNNSEIVDRNCQHMLALVNNLLDQAKIEAGQLAIQKHPDKLRAVVSDAIATVQPLLHGKPVKLRTDEIDVPEFLSIDAFRLRQIVLNLLSNAIKFTEKGEISVVSAWHDNELTLSVIDTGPGMPDEAVKRLFTAFEQADASIAAKHGGTGLGLTISRNLARLMGGDIKVHSALGKGTTFTVTVAAERALEDGAEGAAQPASQRAAESVRNVLQGTVLVAEDMPDTRALVVRHLEQLGLTVLQAVNGEQAIEIALAKRPDVVLMDMEMPVVAGPEATRTLRMCGFSAPVLALTAHKGEDGRLRALAAGCNSVVEKPLTRSSLLTALSTALAPESPRVAAGAGHGG
jgi:signal transduction histidine kinase/CheY-like chemotaxis protein